MIIVRSFPRIHIALIDLGNVTSRKYGGAGFTLSGPIIEIEAEPNVKSIIIGENKLDKKGKQDILLALERFNNTYPKATAQLKIKNIPMQHIGLGTKTSVILSSLISTSLITGIKVAKKTIQKYSGRGGTSGIGINSFFTGGFIVDGGHDPKLSPRFAPSGVGIPSNIPPVISHVRIPTDWSFHLALPEGKRVAGESESKFFRENTPIPKIEVYETLSLIYHGVVPAVINNDLSLLKMSIAGLQKIGFKGREVNNQSDVFKKLIKNFENIPDCAIGLSSMGPLIYFISHKKDKEVIRSIKDFCVRHNIVFLGTHSGQNRGFEVLNGSGRSS